jgi:hypothetical protein
VTAPGKAPACDCTVLSPTEIGCNGLDDDCNGQIDEGSKTCGTTCVDLKNDANNCGSCGLVCGGGMICKAGVCACPTTKPYVCGAKCVDFQSDIANCGSCNNGCNAGPNGAAACNGGLCALSCTVPYGNCDGNLGNGCEADLRSDVANCGACKAACKFANASATCSTGTCLMGACALGFADCDKDPTTGCETDARADLANCGGCGVKCAPANATGQCNAGKCELLLCKAGFGNCNASAGDGCEVDLQNDPKNCATCGHVCPGSGAPNATASCTSGACGVACAGGFDSCDGNWTNGCETDLRTNANCGKCGNVCGAGTSCVAGVCKLGTPVDVTVLLDVTGSTNPLYTATVVNNLQTRLVAPLLALSDTFVGVSYTAEFPLSTYGATGDRPFQGGVEPQATLATIDAAITGRPTTMMGGDTPDAMVEALGTLAGLPASSYSSPLTCSAARAAGGCWRSGSKRVIVLFTDDIFHNGPDPAVAGALYAAYTGITPAPMIWPDVLAAMKSSGIVLLIANLSAQGASAPGQAQWVKMLTDLGQTSADVFLSNTDPLSGTAADAIVARIAAIHG